MNEKTTVPQTANLLFESDLPETANDLVRLVGWEGAHALIKALGGIPFPVPKAADNNRAGAARYAQLAEIVGEDGADKIIAEYGDDVLNIPNCRNALAKAKNRAMVAYYDSGKTIEETALAFGVTTRWVSIVCKKSACGSGRSFRVPA